MSTSNPVLSCTVKDLAWAAWRRDVDVVGSGERARFDAWWARVVAAQPRRIE